MPICRFLYLTLCLSILSHADAETLALDSVGAFVRARNFDLAAARWKIEEARGRLLGSGKLANPEVEAERRRNTRGREFSVGVGFVQRFPLTDRLALEKAVSRAELAAAEAEVRDAERRLVGEAKSLAAKWLAIRDRRVVLERQAKLAEELAEHVQKTADKAEGSSLDASQARLAANRQKLEAKRLDAERAAIAGELAPLLGLPVDEPLAITGELGAQAPRSETPTTRADIRAADHLTEAAAQAVALARAKRWDDLSVGVAAEHERAEDAPEGLRRDNFVGLKLSFPIPLWNKNEGEISEKTAAYRRALQEAAARRAQAAAEAATALAESRNLAETLAEIDRKLSPESNEHIRATDAAYRNAQVTLTELLRAREQGLALELQRLDVLRDLALAQIRHETATAR